MDDLFYEVTYAEQNRNRCKKKQCNETSRPRKIKRSFKKTRKKLKSCLRRINDYSLIDEDGILDD